MEHKESGGFLGVDTGTWLQETAGQVGYVMCWVGQQMVHALVRACATRGLDVWDHNGCSPLMHGDAQLGMSVAECLMHV